MKFATKLAAATAVAALAGLGLSACAADTTSNDPNAVTVTVVTPYLANAATKESIDDFTTQAEALGWSVSVVDTAGDMNKLNSAFQDAAAQQPDAIVLGSGDPTQISLGLKSAANAGVPVFAIDAAAADGIAANVTSDNTDLGTQSATALVEFMGGTGSVVMLTHDPHPGVKARTAGALKVFKGAGIEVIEQKHVNVPGPVDDARTSIQDIISARGSDVNGVWAGWDEPALGATQALEAAGISNVPVVGVDGQDFARAAIKTGGPFKATVSQDWNAITAKVVELIKAQVVDGQKPASNQVELPGTLVK